MDAVRFGRALGFGTRQAVKTVTSAVSAATAENPSGKSAGTAAKSTSALLPNATQAQTASGKAVHHAAHAAAQTVLKARETRQGLRRGGQRFGQTTWKTVVRLWGVLWLEVVGVFFGLFALFALAGVWRLRGEWHSTAPEHRQLLGALAMLALFGYFTVSSFVRARRRERRR